LSGFPDGIGHRLEHGRFEMMDACSFGFGLLARLVLVCLLSVWLSFGFRSILVGLVLVLLVLACLLPFGCLFVRSSEPVLDSVDNVLDAWFAWFACLGCLDGVVGW
jgi:hypothetical protein